MSVPPNPADWPAWYNGKTINESLFCQEYLATHQLLYTEQAFFTPTGRMTDETTLKESIFKLIRPYAMTKKIGSIIDLLRITAHRASFPPTTECIFKTERFSWMDAFSKVTLPSFASDSR